MTFYSIVLLLFLFIFCGFPFVCRSYACFFESQILYCMCDRVCSGEKKIHILMICDANYENKTTWTTLLTTVNQLMTRLLCEDVNWQPRKWNFIAFHKNFAVWVWLCISDYWKSILSSLAMKKTKNKGLEIRQYLLSLCIIIHPYKLWYYDYYYYDYLPVVAKDIYGLIHFYFLFCLIGKVLSIPSLHYRLSYAVFSISVCENLSFSWRLVWGSSLCGSFVFVQSHDQHLFLVQVQ